MPRWPLPYDEESWISPSLERELQDINPLNPGNYDIMQNPDIATSVSYSLKLLCDHITTQITSRDLSLVEQSRHGVIAYRPYFPSTLAGGIRRELEHNHEIRVTEPTRKVVILSVLKDRGKHRIEGFFHLLEIFIDNFDTSSKKSLQKLFRQWLVDDKIIEFFCDDSKLASNFPNLRNEIEKILPANYKFKQDFEFYKTSLPPGHIAKEEKERRNAYKYIQEQLLKDPLRDYISDEDEYIEFHSSSEIDNFKFLEE